MATAGLGVLLAAGQPDRRGRCWWGMGVIGIGVALYLLLLNDFYLRPLSVSLWLRPPGDAGPGAGLSAILSPASWCAWRRWRSA